MLTSVAIAVPATTANLGPGFDCLGAALALYNQFEFSHLPALGAKAAVSIQVRGREAGRVKTDASNLVYQAFAYFYQHLGQTPPAVEIQIQLGIPLARGLGSSATAIVAGLVGANQLAGSPLDQTQILKLAIALEGHPDNVVPALLGGCHLIASGIQDGEWEICNIPWSDQVIPVLAIPDFELSTQAARQVLPLTCDHKDAVFNMAHLGLLLRGLETGHPSWLRAALQDRLHQPYRQALIAGYRAVQRAALEAGAHGLVISGAGPTLLALVTPARSEAVAAQIKAAWSAQGIQAQVQPMQIDSQGARVSGQS